MADIANERIEMLQYPAEFKPLMLDFEVLKPKRILEIGCWDGATLREWLQAVEDDATVVAVDLEHRNRELYERWRRDDTTLILYTGDSTSDAAKAIVVENGPYDWAFIDGDHSDAGVRSDVELCRPLMNKGGVIALHDIFYHGGDPAPNAVFKELQAEGHESWSYVDEDTAPWSHGLGMVRFALGHKK